jgi:hypothetical protein
LRSANLTQLANAPLPVDATITNRNFTKNLVPQDSNPPLAGPSRLLPTVPTLEQHLEAHDDLPTAMSGIPLVGSLQVPLRVTSVSWNFIRSTGVGVTPTNQLIQGPPLASSNLYWPPPTFTVQAPGLIGDQTIDLTATDVAQLPSVFPYWMLWWDSVAHPDALTDPSVEIIRVTGINVTGINTVALSITRGEYGVNGGREPRHSDVSPAY